MKASEDTSINRPISGPKLQWNHVIIIVLFLTILAYGVGRIISDQTQTSSSGNQPENVELSQAEFIEKTGVRVVRVALAAGTGMIDLRYQVIDPDRAVIVHDPNNLPAIIDEATGRVLDRPWMEHPHNQKLEAGVTYYTLLVNLDWILRRGSKVTVVMGGQPLENIIVE